MDRIRPVEKKPDQIGVTNDGGGWFLPKDRPCYESHGDGMMCPQCRDLALRRPDPAESDVPVKKPEPLASALLKRSDPPEMDKIRSDFEMLVTNPPLPPSAAQIQAAYARAIPWLLAEIERWQPLGQALADAAMQIGAHALEAERLTAEVEKLTASLERCESRRGKHHGS